MIIDINKKNARIWSMLGMRRVVGMYINNLADEDNRFVFASADVGRYFGIQEYQKNYSERYFDVGIAEQNLVLIAAGLAKEGCNVFAATYSTFITARALDQVRVNMGYMGLGIKLIGVGAGLAEGDLSPTHMGLEDIADIMAIPGITIVCPGDAAETIKAMKALSELNNPAYLRLTGKTNLPILHTQDFDFEIGKSICLKDGKDLVIISCGCILGNVLKAADRLAEEGICARVINMHTIRPLDKDELEYDLKYKLIITVEEHMEYGGLGSVISDYYCDYKERPMIHKICINDTYPMASEYDILLKKTHLDENSLCERIKRRFNMIDR